MPENLVDQLAGSSLKPTILEAVAREDFDAIPPNFNVHARFVICAIRAVANRVQQCDLCVFVYSEAPKADGMPYNYERIAHMQDGHGHVNGKIILTGQDANNGASFPLPKRTIEELMYKLEDHDHHKCPSVIWDGVARSATVYPTGIANLSNHTRFPVPKGNNELTQNDICEALDIAYNDNLKNPSGKTLKLWTNGQLISNAEDAIERQLKGQIATYFAGQKRPISVLSQTPTSSGRTDLILIQVTAQGVPAIRGVLELKVLRGPLSADRAATKEGLSQGYYYSKDINASFVTLALYDVSQKPTNDTGPLLKSQKREHILVVRVRRFAIYSSPKKWRDAGGTQAA